MCIQSGNEPTLVAQLTHFHMQAELERILEENQKHLEMAKARSMAAAAATENTATEKMQSLVQAQPTEAHLGKDVHALGDDVFVLGAGARPTGM
jgi:hypothetical protein